MDKLSTAAARRVALAAQGFGGERPRPVGMRQVQAEIDRLGQFQIDTISVVARAHYLPLYSRLGPYDTALLDRALNRAPRRLFEYWGHAASMIDVELEPALRFRMRRNAERPWCWFERVTAERPEQVAALRAAVAAATVPVTASQLADPSERERERTHWGWNWSQTKTILEHLFTTGEIAAAGRTPSFERTFLSRERALPARIAAAATPSDEEAVLTLVRRAARALGVATVGCLADYFRLRVDDTKRAVATLVDAQELVPVEVPGLPGSYRWQAARRPRRLDVRTLVSPFDSLVFERRRLERLFDTHYRIGIYTPAAERTHGYYVYLFLLGEEVAGRVDLKAERRTGLLRVQSAWAEAGCSRPDAEVARALVAELELLATWLGLGQIVPPEKGSLAQAVRSALA